MEIYIDVYILENIIIDLFLLLLSFIDFYIKKYLQIATCYQKREQESRIFTGTPIFVGITAFTELQEHGRQSLWEPIFVGKSKGGLLCDT